MLNFDFFNQTGEVKRALSHRLNHKCMDGLRYQDRQLERSRYCEVVWLIPLDGNTVEYHKAIPAVSKDLSIQGLSLIHTAPLTQDALAVAMPGPQGIDFFYCKVQHCSDMGFGFFQIGLFPSRIVKPEPSEIEAWESRRDEFAEQPVA